MFLHKRVLSYSNSKLEVKQPLSPQSNYMTSNTTIKASTFTRKKKKIKFLILAFRTSTIKPQLPYMALLFFMHAIFQLK